MTWASVLWGAYMFVGGAWTGLLMAFQLEYREHDPGLLYRLARTIVSGIFWPLTLGAEFVGDKV